MSMAMTRTTGRSLMGITRGVQQASWKPLRSLPMLHDRSFSHTTIPSSICPSAAPGPRSYTRAQDKSRQSLVNIIARRTFSASSTASHGDWSPPKAGQELYITFIDKDGDETKIAVSKGDNLLDIAQANDIEMEGACGGSCACSTCHVIVENEDLYDNMPEPSDDENDMLDLAFGLTETSRLGCQVIMDQSLNGIRVKLPSMTRNLQASDFSQKNERSD